MEICWAMSNRYASNGEPNLMMYYFPRSSAVYRFMDLARAAIKTGKFNGIDHKLVQRAKAEFDEFRKRLDAETPYFSHEMADMALGADTRRKIALVQGRFEGDYEEKSTIGRDLGKQPYRLFKQGERPRNETLDDYITKEAVRDYLRTHYTALKSRGVEGFRVKHSAIFSFRDADLRHPIKNPDGSINMEQLLPLVADTILNDDKQTGYIGIKLVTLPTPEEYAALSLPFTSSRIKASIGRKLVKLLRSGLVPVRDIGANRAKVASLDVVRDLEGRMERGQIGRSTIEIIPGTKKDFYRRPKPNGYRAVQFSAYATTRGRKFVREIQLIDEAQYYRNEINPNNPAHHRQQEKKQESSEGQIRQIPEQIFGAIQTIFGKSTISITLADALKD